MSTVISDAVVSGLEMVSKFFLVDLATLSDEQVTQKANGTARSPLNFGYEVVAVAERGLAIIKGEKPEPFDLLEKEGDWVIAPASYTRQQLASDFERVHNEVIAQFRGKTDEEMMATVDSFFGPGPLFSIGNFLTMHANYHNAQLSYIAQLGGDLKNHWWSGE
ncbi:MAG TPA: DinB family protein [Fimbriimonas sp.]|nr:DinB family protein [Fimbriimonas sp.]